MRSRDLLAAAVGAIVATALAEMTWAVPGPGVIQGCYMKTNGQLRIVGTAADCGPSELALSWNEVGPSGAQGETGPTGPEGPPGTSPFTKVAELPLTYNAGDVLGPGACTSFAGDYVTDLRESDHLVLTQPDNSFTWEVRIVSGVDPQLGFTICNRRTVAANLFNAKANLLVMR